VSCLLLASDFNQKVNFSAQISINVSGIKFHENPSSKADFLHSDRQTDGQTDGQIYIGIYILLLQSALQPLVGFRPAQLSLSILSSKVLQSAVASGTSNPQLGGEPGI
jgi:hypothetical protein